jgi:hypothetical protein
MRTCIFCRATLIVLSSAIGCGGAASSSQSSDEGPLATCGDNCSAAQVSASCSDICGKIAQTGCSVAPEGPMNCAAVTSMSPSCVAVVDGFLRCVESTEPICSDAGMLQFVGCDAQQRAVTACLDDSVSSSAGAVGPGPSATAPNAVGSVSPGTAIANPDASVPGAPPAGSSVTILADAGASPAGPSTGPSTGPCAAVPATVCPDIPRPLGAGLCSGSGTAGPNGTTTSVTSMTTCQDSAGNVWQSECVDSSCTCAYNGGQACTCTMTGPPTCSCCPGTF